MSFNNYYYVKEAFQEKDMQKATALIKSHLEKKIGIKLYQKFGVDYFKNSKGSGEGIRYFLPDGRSLRFNFSNGEIESVDIWKADVKDPTVTVETKGISITQILPFIEQTLNVPKTGSFEVETEQKSTVTNNTDDKVVEESFIFETQIVVKSGSPEENNNPDVAKVQKKLDNIKFSDPEFVYKDLDSLVKLVAEGKIYSLLITGLPGTGKTYTTTKILNEYGSEGSFYIHNKGVTTPLGLYRTLYENNGKVIVFDDSDKVLLDTDSISILKAALDNKKERKITWTSRLTFNPDGMSEEEIESYVKDGDLPNRFVFNGSVIFITNLYQDKVDRAVRSRSYHIDITLKRQDIIARIRQIMENIQPNISMEIKNDVLDFMDKNQEAMKSNLDLRSFDKAVTFAASGDPNWKRLVLKYV